MHALYSESGKYTHGKDSNFNIFIFRIPRQAGPTEYSCRAEIKIEYVLNVACEAIVKVLLGFRLFLRIFRARMSIREIQYFSLWPNVTVSAARI